jgi:hypothetical protein
MADDIDVDELVQVSPVPTQAAASNGAPDLADLAPTFESLQAAPSPPVESPASTAEIEAENQQQPSDTSMLYVDYSEPASLRSSETMAFYLTLREAIAAWLALPNEIKKDASITTTKSGTSYHGWEIYRLWGRWDA